ncbi:SMC-Scp complex subunit ScpB [Candidatus Woesearchaeota archaeon]|nr:SMC-Scp complex subunit ScpB [Candidatus Woesearchaeota archaeon]
MESKAKRVEAVLFAVGKEITTERIASLCTLEVQEVEAIMGSLIEEYKNKDHSLQIIKRDNGWKLTVRDEFVPLVSAIVSSTELEGAIMQTLAVIAWKYPIIQSDLIKMRGTGAYEHMKQLEDQGFIIKEKFARTFKIKLTQKFFEYFDLPSEEAKQAFLNIIPPEVLQEAEKVEKEADETERILVQETQEQETRKEIKTATEGAKRE